MGLRKGRDGTLRGGEAALAASALVEGAGVVSAAAECAFLCKVQMVLRQACEQNQKGARPALSQIGHVLLPFLPQPTRRHVLSSRASGVGVMGKGGLAGAADWGSCAAGLLTSARDGLTRATIDATAEGGGGGTLAFFSRAAEYTLGGKSVRCLAPTVFVRSSTSDSNS
jgi:hypothetical protein